jgi:hypothetical protein
MGRELMSAWRIGNASSTEIVKLPPTTARGQGGWPQHA